MLAYAAGGHAEAGVLSPFVCSRDGSAVESMGMCMRVMMMMMMMMMMVMTMMMVILILILRRGGLCSSVMTSYTIYFC
jgi:hypothetical protein